jgi:SHS2 domain-containing protein
MSDESPAGYEYFEVEADVGIHAWAGSARDAFAQAALAAFALMVDPAEVTATETREVRAQGRTREDLLVAWINECLYVHDIEGFVVHSVSVDVCDESLVHGVLHGQEFDGARHRPGTLVKAATMHGVTVAERAGRWDVRLVVDV